jgi:exonuclease VII small subunit
MPESIVYDQDPTFTSHFWMELFSLHGTKFNFSSAYHPQTDGQTEVLNCIVEMYLRCLTSSKPKEWVTWLPWVEYCYNTSTHSAHNLTPFELVHGRRPPTLLSYVKGIAQVEVVEKTLVERDQLLKKARDRLLKVQHRMTQIYNKHHKEKHFGVGDWVYLKLQPYRQSSIEVRSNAKLHGMPESIVCDRDPTFTSHFWTELFSLHGTKFNFSSTYHLQTDGQTEVLNRIVEMYLRCFISSKPKEWVTWLPWVEYCYNNSTHSAHNLTPFELVYGRRPPTLLSYVKGTAQVEAVEKTLVERDQLLKEARDRLLKAQHRMTQIYNKHHKEKHFGVGDWVYLKLQPYRQSSST